MVLSKKQRTTLRIKFGGFCAYCGKELPEKGWHADHIAPVVRRNHYVYSKGFVQTGAVKYPEREALENLHPSCMRCNIRKFKCSIEQFRNEIEQQAFRLRRDSNSFKLAEDFGVITDNKIKVVFWFEKYMPPKVEEIPPKKPPIPRIKRK